MSDAVRPELLIARLTSNDERWRVDAEARLIGLGAAAVPLLVGAMQHANAAVRVHAAHALARIRDERGIRAVVRALGDVENNGAVAIAAEKALVEWGISVKAALLEVAKGPDQAVRPRALRALGKIGGADLEPVLKGFLDDPTPAIRTQAAVALGEVLGAAAAPTLVRLLADPDKWVRYGVAEALVAAGSTAGEKVLQQAALDPEEQGTHVQFWAEELLDQIGELRRTGRTIG